MCACLVWGIVEANVADGARTTSTECTRPYFHFLVPRFEGVLPWTKSPSPDPVALRKIAICVEKKHNGEERRIKESRDKMGGVIGATPRNSEITKHWSNYNVISKCKESTVKKQSGLGTLLGISFLVVPPV